MELPLGATEDRICGTIDIEKALSEGVKAYEPGLLVRAWGGGKGAGGGCWCVHGAGGGRVMGGSAWVAVLGSGQGFSLRRVADAA